MSDKELFLTIGALLRKQRIGQGYKSYKDFAHQHGITPSMYQEAETGNNLQILSLYKILSALDVTIQIGESEIKLVSKSKE